MALFEPERRNQPANPEDADTVAALTQQLKERDLAIEILSAQLAAKETRLDQITGSLGWQIINRYSWIKYYFWPAYRLFGRVLGYDPAEPTAAVAMPNALASLPAPLKYDVICFPIIDWMFRFQRPQQLLTQFAKDGHRVFYVKTTFHQSSPHVLVRPIAENIYELQLPGPSHISANTHAIDKPILESLLAGLDEFRSRAGLVEAVSLIHLPFWAPLAFEARVRWQWKIIYDCIDEHSGFSNIRHAALLPEEALIQRSDLVIATSKILFEKISRGGRKVLLLPNAVDFDYFHQPGPLRLLDHIPKPIIGYYGAISDWFDVKMIEHAAFSRPNWQFVLIGDTTGANVSPLKRLKNVHLLGEQAYLSLSSYLKDFDVACIPFLITRLTRATNPVKFYEYLSAGKPVVAVELPELEPYAEYFYPVRSLGDFVSQVEAALSERSPEKVQARIEFARQNTWKERYKVLSATIKTV